MTREEKLKEISEFEGGYAAVDSLIAGLGRQALLFVPPIEDAWSINDFLVHFLDADMSLSFRVRTAMAEPGKTVPVWDEAAWHDKLHYPEEDGPSCLALAKGIRTFMAASLRAAVDEEWSGYVIEHPTRGRLDLAGLLEMYRQHVIFHLPLIKRNVRAWESRV
jgi:hypothetical protein